MIPELVKSPEVAGALLIISLAVPIVMGFTRIPGWAQAVISIGMGVIYTVGYFGYGDQAPGAPCLIVIMPLVLWWLNRGIRTHRRKRDQRRTHESADGE